MSSELTQKVEQLGKAVTALTEFNRDLHKALKEISAPVVDLSEINEKLNKIGEMLFNYLEKPVEKKITNTKG